MKIGVNLLNFGEGTDPASLGRWARLAEELGYHFLMLSDHVAMTPDVTARYPAPFYDPYLTLAWLAGQTRGVELGTTVIILPYRHPLYVARLSSNLDQLSGGRFILGVGAGWARQEFAALGIPFEQRGRLTDAALDTIRASWTSGVITWQDVDVATSPPPVRQPHPPIWVGGNSPAGIRRAVRYGDAWHPISIRVDWLNHVGLPRLRAEANAAGMPTPALCPRIRLQLSDTPLDDAQRLAGQGTIAQVHADLVALEALGATHVLLDPYDGNAATTREHERGWSMLATLAERVLDLTNDRIR